MNRAANVVLTVAAASCLAVTAAVAVSASAAGALARPANAAMTASAANPAASAVHPAARAAGGHWTAAVPVSGLATLNAGHDAMLGDIACASGGNCAAAGTYDANIGGGGFSREAFVASEVRGVRRAATAIPRFARLNAGGWAQITADQCASPGNCAVGGSYENAAGVGLTFVANEVRGTWRAARTIPGTADPTGQYSSGVSALTCTAAATCTAVGADGADGADGFITAEKDGAWGKTRLVPDLTADGTSVDGVSCRSPGNCVATGSALLDSGDDSYSAGAESFDLTETKGSWGKPALLTVGHGGTTDSAVLACGPGGDCSVSGNIQYGISYQTSTAPFSAYVATYTPAA